MSCKAKQHKAMCDIARAVFGYKDTEAIWAGFGYVLPKGYGILPSEKGKP